MNKILTQIWNQRRANAWVWTELTVVCVLLWYAVDLVYNYEGAAWQPKGYDTDCVFDMTVATKPGEIINDEDNARAGEDFLYLYNLIKDYPGVEAVCSYYGSVPYTNNITFEGYASHEDSTRTVGCKIRYVSPEYFEVFRLKPVAGSLDASKWRFSEVPTPVLMSTALADSLFHTTGADVIGKTCFNPYWMLNTNPKYRVTNYQVMAVLPNHKLDEYQRYEPFIYLPTPTLQPLFWHHIAIRVNPEHVSVKGFAERFRQDMQQVFNRGIFYLDRIESYADMKESYDIGQGTVNYLNSAYAVIAFFVFNIFLSILGTFWFRTRKRRSEIALRMAMGCSRRGILRHYLIEGLLLLLLAAVPAFLICLNIYMGDITVHTLMDATFPRLFGTFAVAVLLLAVIVSLGIFFPARQAMKVEPAEALHEE